MEFVANKRELVRALGRVVPVADKKSALPILTNLLVVADASGLRLSATDLTLSVSVHCKADVRKGGTVALPAKHLLDVTKVLPDGDVTVAVAKNFAASIKSGKRRFELRGMPGEDFPAMPDAGKVKFTTIPADDLAEAIAMAQHSMSDDDTRPHLSAALVELAGDTLRVVTTDGHRLTKVERTVSGMKGAATLLIPTKAVHEFKRLVDDLRGESKGASAGPLVVSLGATKDGPVFLRRDGMTLSTKLVDAAFPAYGAIIPSTADHTVTLSRAALLDAVRAMGLIADAVSLAVTSRGLTIRGINADVGEASDELDAALQGPDVSISFGTKYLAQMLGAMVSDEVTLECSGPKDPALWRMTGRDDFMQVLMPRGDV